MSPLYQALPLSSVSTIAKVLVVAGENLLSKALDLSKKSIDFIPFGLGEGLHLPFLSSVLFSVSADNVFSDLQQSSLSLPAIDFNSNPILNVLLMD